ncbi:MAG: transposase [Calditrichaeota bacterium]|nr:MAG: transposase [Calditrichota bacterium]
MNKPFEKGKIYHVFNRGCNRGLIFFSNENYLYLLRKVKSTYERYGVGVLAYCLMPNHYHFLLKQKTDRPLSDWIKTLFNGYVQAVNKQQKRTGTLFEGRAQHVLVDNNAYFVHLARYIHLNPVKAKLVKNPADWQYSNYLEWIEKRNGTLVNREFIRSYFEKPKFYEEFVADHIIDDSDIQKYLFE